MIKLIVGQKGSGKTKTLIDMINAAAKEAKGNVVCVEKGLKMTYDISHAVRLIDIEHYDVKGFDAFYGFLAGVCAGNYDITDVFVDGTLKIGGRDYAAFGAMIAKIEALQKENDFSIVFTVSCDVADLPESVKQYIL